ncbi:MAG: hypothetical protein Q8R70_03945 [Methanoregula sp.]|nr:hypothetical protein [Methanoregula sp.]
MNRYRYLEPCPNTGRTRFGDRDAGDREDLAGEEEAKQGVVPEQPITVSGR